MAKSGLPCLNASSTSINSTKSRSGSGSETVFFNFGSSFGAYSSVCTSSPPVSNTPSQRATDSATSDFAGMDGAIHGNPPAEATAMQYWFERLTELSSNSTPRLVVLGEMRIRGGRFISLGYLRVGE